MGKTELKPKEMETFLTDENIQYLKKMFSNEENFIDRMKVITQLREIARKFCVRDTSSGEVYDQSSPFFGIWILANELIVALNNDCKDNGCRYHFYTVSGIPNVIKTARKAQG
jgi:hypothetical protein